MAPRTSAIVTGAGRGLGRAITVALARRGHLVLAVDVDADAAAATAATVQEDGGEALGVAGDVAEVAGWTDLVGQAETHAPLGVLVNNAGVGFSAPLVDVTPEQFDRLMGINLRGAFFGLQAAARVMIPRGSGSIVNLASTSGFTASTTPMVPYDTSKGAVRMLTVSAARELAPSGVRVNAVAPGTIDTELTRSLAVDPDALDRLVARRIPLGRLGAPEDIAEAVAWLSSDDASYVTGHTLVVDGGWLT
jgi:NAD(P)-dependent dehydrogenase (short-subunit alcohol dehydrogenase family)